MQSRCAVAICNSCGGNDVKQCSDQTHAGVDARHIVCKNCLVPLCDECYDFISRAPLYASPSAAALILSAYSWPSDFAQ